MNKEELRQLVKKHFNLVDAPAVEETVSEETVEETTEQTFGEIKSADGELTLVYEGDELAVGLPIFVVTPDGNVPAPDGEHALEGGVSIRTEGGSITEIMAEEVEVEAEDEDKEYEEGIEEDMSEETLSIHEELIKALSSEFKTQMESLKEEFTTQINAVKEEFGAQPAAEKTITNKKQSYGRSAKVDLTFEPRNEEKKAQFERILKARKK